MRFTNTLTVAAPSLPQVFFIDDKSSKDFQAKKTWGPFKFQF